MKHLLLLSLLLWLTAGQPIEEIPRRHDYRHAIKKPIVFGEGILPHYDIIGDIMSSPEWLRIAPSVQSKKGGVWSELPVEFPNWEVVMSFSITGRGRLGGDGMAMWLTKERLGAGDAMGSQDSWDGLMLMFDTYDNDNKRNNPYVGAILNDGSLRFSPDADGSDLAFNGCQRNFRNTPVPVFVKVTYYKGVLTVAMDVNGRGQNFLPCFEQAGIEIPSGYYFGISAATGALADDHDLISFEVYELDAPPKKIPEATNAPAGEQMDEQQFEKIQEMVQEIRAKQDVFEVDETYNFFLGKLNNVEELLSGLSQITNSQEQIKQTASTALSLIETLYSKIPQANPSLNPNNPASAPNPNSQASNPNAHNENANVNANANLPILSKLSELQGELRKLAGKQEGSGPSASLVSSITSIETSLKMIESRLSRLESQPGVAAQVTQIIKEELSKGPSKASYSSKRSSSDDESSGNTLLIIVVIVLALIGLGGGAYFVANRKSSPKKFI